MEIGGTEMFAKKKILSAALCNRVIETVDASADLFVK